MARSSPPAKQGLGGGENSSLLAEKIYLAELQLGNARLALENARLELELAHVKQDYANFARLENAIVQKQHKIAHLIQHVAEIRSSAAKPDPAINQKPALDTTVNETTSRPQETEPDVSGGNMEPNASGGNKEDLQATDQLAVKPAVTPADQPADQPAEPTAAYTPAAPHTTMKTASTKAYTAAAGGRIEKIEWNTGMGIGIIYDLGAPRTFDIIGIG